MIRFWQTNPSFSKLSFTYIDLIDFELYFFEIRKIMKNNEMKN